jgi:hypothetical protein
MSPLPEIKIKVTIDDDESTGTVLLITELSFNGD